MMFCREVIGSMADSSLSATQGDLKGKSVEGNAQAVW